MTRRLCRVALSVGMTAGAVLLVRWCIRAVVLSGPGDGQQVMSPVASPVVRAEKTFDLSRMIPRALEVSAMGISADIEERHLPMPIELAEKTCAAEAEAKGWENKDGEVSLSLRARVFGGQRIYVRPDKAYVLQRLTPAKGGGTNVREFALPTDAFAGGVNENMTFDELQTMHGMQMLGLVPQPLRNVVLGSPVFTQLMRRNAGCAFLVGTVGPLSVKAAERELEKALAANGWTRQENLSRGHAFANLSLQAEVRERTGAPGYEIVYRFSDDEVYFTKKGEKENEN